MDEVTVRRIRIFLSSPGDVGEARSACAAVVQELNMTLNAFLPQRRVELELLRWETHTHPDTPGSAQKAVDGQMSDFDVFVGIMWSRFGTPTDRWGSGTEHEFRQALQSRDALGRPAHLLVYFCEAPVPVRAAVTGAAQLARVMAFRDELSARGLVGSYEEVGEFADQVRRHLVMVVGRLLDPDESTARVAARIGQLAQGDLAVVRAQVDELAREYVLVRASMDSGWDRTRRLEIVASRMRTLAPSAFVLLPTLTASDDPGVRLVAVSALEVVPDVEYVDWLAERFPEERAFVQYHAAVALQTAARELGLDELDRVRAALGRALWHVAELPGENDRVHVLRSADREVRNRQVHADPGRADTVVGR
jgi:Domain of unknown function (DUF4062)